MSSYGDKNLRHAFLVQFNFLSGPMYVWNGFRNLQIGGTGPLWRPVGPNATVDQIEDAVSDSVPTVVLRISGVSKSNLTMALSESNEIRNQMAFISDIFFDPDWQPIGTPESYAVVRMDTLRIIKQRNADNSFSQTIEINCENYLTNGPCPPAGRYSSADQWAREGNDSDLYFEYMSANQNRRQRWPTF